MCSGARRAAQVNKVALFCFILKLAHEVSFTGSCQCASVFTGHLKSPAKEQEKSFFRGDFRTLAGASPGWPSTLLYHHHLVSLQLQISLPYTHSYKRDGYTGSRESASQRGPPIYGKKGKRCRGKFRNLCESRGVWPSWQGASTAITDPIPSQHSTDRHGATCLETWHSVETGRPSSWSS